MQEPTVFDVAVIGNGMFGSAATKHLARRGHSVLCIGAPQPAPGQPALRHTVHSSHYDAGRLVRRQSRSSAWSMVTTRSIESFRSIETESGIEFYRPVGCLIASLPGGDGINDDPLDNLADSGIPHDFYPPGDQAWQQRWPDLAFPASHYVAYEDAPAGYVRPLDLIAAQNVIARQYDAKIVAATALGVSPVGRFHEIPADNGDTYRARHVLVAAGAFTNFNRLLAEPIDLSLKTEWILLGEISARDADKLGETPTVKFLLGPEEQSSAAFVEGLYMVPPVRYPDGRHYIKLGANTEHDQRPTEFDSVQRWFERAGERQPVGEKAVEAALRHHLEGLWPNLEFASFGLRRCIVTYTPDGRPTISTVGEGLHVATGGNGAGAKGSDAWGALAADLITEA